MRGWRVAEALAGGGSAVFFGVLALFLPKNRYSIKNYAYLTSYDDGVVLTSSVSKFRTRLHRFHRKRSKLSRVLFVSSDHPWVGRGWVAGGPWVGHKAGRVIGHPPREEKIEINKPHPETDPNPPRAQEFHTPFGVPLSLINIVILTGSSESNVRGARGATGGLKDYND